MIAAITERSEMPFHLGLTELNDEATMGGYSAIEGAYDPVEQVWKLPSGKPLTDPEAREIVLADTPTLSVFDIVVVDDLHLE